MNVFVGVTSDTWMKKNLQRNNKSDKEIVASLNYKSIAFPVSKKAEFPVSKKSYHKIETKNNISKHIKFIYQKLGPIVSNLAH